MPYIHLKLTFRNTSSQMINKLQSGQFQSIPQHLHLYKHNAPPHISQKVGVETKHVPFSLSSLCYRCNYMLDLSGLRVTH